MIRIILGSDEQDNLSKLRSIQFEDDVFITRNKRQACEDSINQNYDIVHCGSSLMNDSTYELLKWVSMNWHYLDPQSDLESNTWKCGTDFVWIKKDLDKSVGGFDFEFESTDAILSEFCYRVLRHGGRVKYIPRNLPKRQTNISISDQLNFIKKYFGFRYVNLIYPFLLFQYGIVRTNLLIRKCKRSSTKFDRQRINLSSYNIESTFKVEPYTAIIPTINRYPYLEKSILSLINNKYPPAEIIVVDQTPLAFRDQDLISKYQESVNWIFLDKPGQSTARNTAIEVSQNELVLLFEDDGEAWDDMVEQHFKLMSIDGVDVSTGVALAPWKTKEHIPKQIRGYHIADVLATGNAMVRKLDLKEVSGLDKAFDHGSGADDDLGKRLFLRGKEIVFNPYAIMTHHKAPIGGMREHGAWWRNKANLLGEYPPATQMYAILKYYSNTQRISLIWIQFIKAFKRNNILEQVTLFAFAPVKLFSAYRKAKRLMRIEHK